MYQSNNNPCSLFTRFQCGKINVLFPILIIRFYEHGFNNGDQDIMLIVSWNQKTNSKPFFVVASVKPPNIPKETFTSLKKILLGNLHPIILNCIKQTEVLTCFQT